MEKRAYRQHDRNVNSEIFPHGEHAGYKAGCRCDSCRAGFREFKRAYMMLHRQQNEEYRERQNSYARLHKKSPGGKAICKSNDAKRKQLVKAIDANVELLKEIYMNCPNSYQVDHIIPLSKGGKHHQDNLQYLPSEINNKKRATLNFNCSNVAIKWQSILGNLQRPSGNGVGASVPKRIAPRTGEDMVCSAWEHAAAL